MCKEAALPPQLNYTGREGRIKPSQARPPSYKVTACVHCNVIVISLRLCGRLSCDRRDLSAAGRAGVDSLESAVLMV